MKKTIISIGWKMMRSIEMLRSKKCWSNILREESGVKHFNVVRKGEGG